MCLAVPAKILSIDGTVGRCDIEGTTVMADLSLVPEAVPGDYVIVHAGIAIQKYDEQEAQETLKLLRELASAVSAGEGA